MKMKTLAVVAGIGAPMILAGSANAGFVGVEGVLNSAFSFEIKNGGQKHGLLVINIYAEFDAREGDFLQAVAGTPLSPLSINTRGGNFFQYTGPFSGGDQTSDPAGWEFFPTSEFDTYVTVGAKSNLAGSDHTAISPDPDWPGFGPDRITGNNMGWFLTNPGGDPQGIPDAVNTRVLIAQLSMVKDPAINQGFFGTVVLQGLSNGVLFNETHTFDTQVPAPGALALLGTAGLLGVRRRRRR